MYHAEQTSNARGAHEAAAHAPARAGRDAAGERRQSQQLAEGWWEPVADYVVNVCSDAEAVSALCSRAGEHLSVDPAESAASLVRTSLSVMANSPVPRRAGQSKQVR